METRPIVVKYGGNAMDEPLLPDIAALVATGTPVVLVHGGGPEIDRWLSERGISTHRIDGLRVTDAPTLATTEAVLCGAINKRLVRECAALGLNAVGISGEDAELLVARPVENRALGFVGEIASCNPRVVHTLLEAGFVPIVAPLAVAQEGRHALNINADLAAAAIAGALKAQALILVTNVPRVFADRNDPQSAIDRLTLEQAREFLTSPACEGGMKPKIEAAIAAVESGATRSLICGAGAGSIAAALRGDATIVSAS